MEGTIMKIVGLVGGVGSGKSTVARALEQWGASIVDVDKIGHEVLCFPEIIAQMKYRWHWLEGDTIGIDQRHEIAKVVFEDYVELDFLEAITRPLILSGIEKKLSLFNKEFGTIVILDFPLLFESGLDKKCDKIVFVDCPNEQRFKNFRNRRIPYGESEADSRKTFIAREKRQKSIEFKLDNSSFVIFNDMGEGFKKEIENAWKGLINV